MDRSQHKPAQMPAMRRVTRLMASRKPSAACSLLRACSNDSSVARRGIGREHRREDRLERAVRRLLREMSRQRPRAPSAAHPGPAPATGPHKDAACPMAARERFRIVHLNAAVAASAPGFSASIAPAVHALYKTSFPQSYLAGELETMLAKRDLGAFVTLCVLWAGSVVAATTLKVLAEDSTLEVVCRPST